MTEGEYDTLVAQLKAAQARYNAALNAVGEQVSLIGVRRKELALAQQMVADSQDRRAVRRRGRRAARFARRVRAGRPGRRHARPRRPAAIHGRRARKPARPPIRVGPARRDSSRRAGATPLVAADLARQPDRDAIEPLDPDRSRRAESRRSSCRPACSPRPKSSSTPMPRRSSCRRRRSADSPACKRCGSSPTAWPSSRRSAPAAKRTAASRSSTASTPATLLVAQRRPKATTGPVIAVDEPPARRCRRSFPKRARLARDVVRRSSTSGLADVV